MTATLATTPLSTTDRCDSCGAQAYVRAVLDQGDLLFCGHHGRKFEATLRPKSLGWHDETSRLTTSEPVG
ncbi:DUF7455 domain-containing protein [Phytoactinopolyspora limicola]|uniref:DUF7455 domain-containing protein n=1 Tax=Phytoactinopolyspora limicola TaxID=2715536 RepID=UPI00140A438C|nr:hypothetical protein [Phytoactinopolyspora limicola]